MAADDDILDEVIDQLVPGSADAADLGGTIDEGADIAAGGEGDGVSIGGEGSGTLQGATHVAFDPDFTNQLGFDSGASAPPDVDFGAGARVSFADEARASFDPPDEVSSHEISLGPGIDDAPTEVWLDPGLDDAPTEVWLGPGLDDAPIDMTTPEVDPGADAQMEEPDPIE
jgi:hypothetical protein